MKLVSKISEQRFGEIYTGVCMNKKIPKLSNTTTPLVEALNILYAKY